MSLIQCPECKKEISDKVRVCPFCGYPFESKTDAEQGAQKVEITSVNIKSKNPAKMRKIIFGVVAVVAFLAIGSFFYIYMQNNNQKSIFNNYVETLVLGMDTMLDGGSDAESLLNLTGRVWYNTIYEKSDSETDKFTKNGSIFNEDFNTSLFNLSSDSSTLSTIFIIEKNQGIVESIMKDLQNPPKGLENCYETVTELYSLYKGFTDLAINPSGNYNSFTENKSNKIDKFMELFNKLKTQIPEKK